MSVLLLAGLTARSGLDFFLLCPSEGLHFLICSAAAEGAVDYRVSRPGSAHQKNRREQMIMEAEGSHTLLPGTGDLEELVM